MCSLSRSASRSSSDSNRSSSCLIIVELVAIEAKTGETPIYGHGLCSTTVHSSDPEIEGGELRCPVRLLPEVVVRGVGDLGHCSRHYRGAVCVRGSEPTSGCDSLDDRGVPELAGSR